MASKYGDRPAGRVLLAESAAQLGLELAGGEPAAKQEPAAPKSQRRVLADGIPHPSEFPRATELPAAPSESITSCQSLVQQLCRSPINLRTE